MVSRLTPIAEIPPDTVLSEALTDAAGRVLLPAGTQLHAPLLESLQRRGISAVPVALPEAAPLSADALAEREKQLLLHVDYLFRLAGEGAVVDRLRGLVLEHRLKNARPGTEPQKL